MCNFIWIDVLMFVSIFDLFIVGIGLLSFYCIGLMCVVKDFIDWFGDFVEFVLIWVELFGLFVLMGCGYGIDWVVCLGFIGYVLEIVDLVFVLLII